MAQLIKSYWHLFNITEESNHILLEKVITIKRTNSKSLNASHFSDINTSEKITIKHLQFSVSNEHILKF